jgi:hypothetical protein
MRRELSMYDAMKNIYRETKKVDGGKCSCGSAALSQSHVVRASTTVQGYER